MFHQEVYKINDVNKRITPIETTYVESPSKNINLVQNKKN